MFAEVSIKSDAQESAYDISISLIYFIQKLVSSNDVIYPQRYWRKGPLSDCTMPLHCLSRYSAHGEPTRRQRACSTSCQPVACHQTAPSHHVGPFTWLRILINDVCQRLNAILITPSFPFILFAAFPLVLYFIVNYLFLYFPCLYVYINRVAAWYIYICLYFQFLCFYFTYLRFRALHLLWYCNTCPTSIAMWPLLTIKCFIVQIWNNYNYKRGISSVFVIGTYVYGLLGNQKIMWITTECQAINYSWLYTEIKQRWHFHESCIA